jgi:hypothetical protein
MIITASLPIGSNGGRQVLVSANDQERESQRNKQKGPQDDFPPQGHADHRFF